MASYESWGEKARNIEQARVALEVERQDVQRELRAVTKGPGSIETKRLRLEALEVRAQRHNDRLAALKADQSEVDAQLEIHKNARALRTGGSALPEGMSLMTTTEIKDWRRGSQIGSPAHITKDGWREYLRHAQQGAGMIDLGLEEHRKAFTRGVVTKTADTWDGTTAAGGITSGAIPPVYFPMVEQATESTRISNLFGHVTIGSPAWRYPRHTGTPTGAAITAEGATKPAMDFTIDIVQGEVQKIAGTYTHTWELARDYQEFVGVEIPLAMTNAYVRAENTALLGQIVEDSDMDTVPAADGLLGSAALTYAVPSTDTAPGSPSLRAVNHAAMVLRQNFFTADSLIISPATFGALRNATDTQGRFLLDLDGDGSVRNGDVPTIWGMSVVVTTDIADGTGLIFDSSKFAKIMVRDGIQLFTTNQGAELASTNKMMHIIESRLGLQVSYPSAGLVITGLATS